MWTEEPQGKSPTIEKLPRQGLFPLPTPFRCGLACTNYENGAQQIGAP
jgi:hypothetical protein